MALSFQEINSLLSDAVQAKKVGQDDYPYVVTTWESEVVYRANRKFWKAPYEINDTETGVTLGKPVEQKEKRSWVAVFSDGEFGGDVEELLFEFKEADPDNSAMVVRSGKIFEAGNYPDKKVSFTEADLDGAVKAFQPVKLNKKGEAVKGTANDLEHRASVLDNKLGGVRKIWRKGKELYGDVLIPKWFDNLLGEDPLRVSLAFNGKKQIVKNALVLNPRITDAAVFTAFSLESEGKSESSGEGKSLGKKTMKLLDAIKAVFGKDVDTDDLDQEVDLPAEFSGEEKVGGKPTKTEAKSKTEEPQFSTETKALNDQLAKLAEQGAARDKQFLRQTALAFADSLITGDKPKALPAQREEIAALFSDAVTLDATTGNDGALFSLDGNPYEGDSVKRVKAFFSNQPVIRMTEEQMSSAVALPAFKAGDETDNARKKQLLEMTNLGRKAGSGGK